MNLKFSFYLEKTNIYIIYFFHLFLEGFTHTPTLKGQLKGKYVKKANEEKNSLLQDELGNHILLLQALLQFYYLLIFNMIQSMGNGYATDIITFANHLYLQRHLPFFFIGDAIFV